MGRKFADEFTKILDNYALYICLAVVLLIVIAILILVFAGKKKKAQPQQDYDWITALGGKDNIVEVSGVGSRLSILLKDKESINRDELTKYGVTSVMSMSGKLTLVIENKAEEIAAEINQKLQ